MNTPPVRFEVIPVGGIRDFAAHAISQAGEGGWVPITRQRAAAQQANPYADPQDPALIVGYSGGEWVAYLGLMPGRLKTSAGFTKVFWSSTLFVDPKCRGQGIGGGLLRTMKALNNDTMGVEVTDVAARLYRSLGMPELAPLICYRATLPAAGRAPAAALPLRAARRALSLVGAAAPALDVAVEASVRRAGARRHASTFHALAERVWREHGRLDHVLHEDPLGPACPGAFTPDAVRSPRPHFHRGPEALDWMLRYKWVAEDHEVEDDVSYAFSNTRHTFRYALVALKDRDGADAGSILFSLSRRSAADPGDVKVLDFQLSPTVSREAVVGVLLEVASRLGAAAIDFPAEFRLGVLAQGGPLDVQPMPRAYFCMHIAPGGALEAVADDVALNACDGDTAFV